MNSKIAEYYKKYINDSNRVSDEICVKEKLPYITDEGKIINTDKFSPSANLFKVNGKYTLHPKGSKDWVDFWKEEHRRIREGYWCGQIRISGYMYFYLNYYKMTIADEEHGEIDSFPKFWRMQFWLDHLFEYAFINKKNFALIKLRGCGLSEYIASRSAKDVMVSDIINNERQNVNILQIAYSAKYLSGGDGLFTKTTSALTWLNQNTDEGIYQPFGHTMKNDEMHWVAGYREKSSNQPIRTGGSIKATIIAKPDDIRGGRFKFGYIEEAGVNPKLDKTVQIGESNTRRGTIKTGILAMWGTSNEEAAGIETFKKILQNPVAYGALSFDNVWRNIEKGKEYLHTIPTNPFEYLIHEDEEDQLKGVGYFIPTYEIKKLDEFGNPNRDDAYDEIMKEREKKINAIGEEDTGVLSYIADNPIYMEEALIVSKGKRFSSNELSRQIVNIETKVIEPEIFRGDIEFVKDNKDNIIGVKFIPFAKGVFKILEHPSHIVKQDGGFFVALDSELPNKRYIAGIDSIDQGTEDSSGQGSSLGALVKKRYDPEKGLDPFGNMYVAIYNERPKYAKDGHENVLKLLLYFKAIGLLEYTKITIKDYIVSLNLGKFLANEPSAPGEVITNYKRKQFKKGLRITSDIIYFYLNLIEQYIKENHQKILFKELLEQLSSYTYDQKTKYDLVAAMGMCEILSAEFRDVSIRTEEKAVNLLPMRWFTDPYTGVKKFGIPSDMNKDFMIDNKQVKYLDVKSGKLIYK